jgi:acyl-CoA synthetase (AMP-forming)/AMP-acid ligase II
VPLNWRLALPELVDLARDCEPVILLADDEFADTAQALAKAVSSLRDSAKIMVDE